MKLDMEKYGKERAALLAERDAAVLRAQEAERERDEAEAWSASMVASFGDAREEVRQARYDANAKAEMADEYRAALAAAERSLEEARGAMFVLGRVVQGDSVEPKALDAAMALWAKEDEARALAGETGTGRGT